MTKAWVFNRPVLFQKGMAGQWKPATKKVMRRIKVIMQQLPKVDQLSAFTNMVMTMLQLDKDFCKEGVEQGFVVPIQGGDGAFGCCHWHGDRDYSEQGLGKLK